MKQITFSGSNGSVKASDDSVLRPIDTSDTPRDMSLQRMARIHTGLSMLRPSDDTDESRTTDDGGLL